MTIKTTFLMDHASTESWKTLPNLGVERTVYELFACFILSFVKWHLLKEKKHVYAKIGAGQKMAGL
jgi:hypothetical protein